jgi:hypothetical protein
MVTFAETAIVDYRLSFADQGKQTSVYSFRFTANKWKFAVSLPFARKKLKLPFS